MRSHLGRNNGNSEDAEIFALAAALDLAVKSGNEGTKPRVVRIFSDAKSVLESLARGEYVRFGSMIGARSSLLDLYHHAEWLGHMGAKVELVWVKGHANSEGNKKADVCADWAVEEQAAIWEREHPGQEGQSLEPKTVADVPRLWKEMGQHWAVEWLFRANMHIFAKKEDSVLEDDRPSQVEEEVDHEVDVDAYNANEERGFVLPAHHVYGSVGDHR